MKLPIVGRGFGSRGVITARNAENIWFEQRHENEKAGFIARALPKIVQSGTGSDIRMLAGIDSGHYAIMIDGVNVNRVNIVGNPLISTAVDNVTSMPWASLPAANFSEPRVTAGHDGWIVTTGHNQYLSVNGLAGVAHPMTGGVEAVACAYNSGYYLIASQERLYWMTTTASAPAALNVVGADASQDYTVDLIDIGPAVAVFGQRTVEFFAVTANPDNPFQPIREATLQVGVAYNRQVKMIGGVVYFWGQEKAGTPGLYAMTGMQCQRVPGSEDLELALMDEPYNMGMVSIDGWVWRGHPFVKLHNVALNRTILFDVSTGTATTITPDAPMAGRTWTIGSSGTVVIASPKSLGIVRHGEVDMTVRRSLTTDNVVSEMLDRITIDNLRIDCEGMGDVTLQVSNNGGDNWRTLDPKLGSNAVNRRVQWNRLGTARQFAFRFSATGQFNLANVMLGARN